MKRKLKGMLRFFAPFIIYNYIKVGQKTLAFLGGLSPIYIIVLPLACLIIL